MDVFTNTWSFCLLLLVSTLASSCPTHDHLLAELGCGEDEGSTHSQECYHESSPAMWYTL